MVRRQTLTVLVHVIEFESVHQNSHSTKLGPLAPAQ